MRTDKPRVGIRLALGFGCAWVLVAILAIIGYRALDTLGLEANDLAIERAPKLILSSQIFRHVGVIARAMGYADR